MVFNVIFSKRANETFESIDQQVQAKWGEKESNEFRKRVYQVVDTISKFPLIFKTVGNAGNVHKAFIHKNCSMFYIVRNNHIDVLFFWDNRQDPIFL